MPCQNGGTCTFDDITATYTCQCVPEYRDTDCETYCAIGSLEGSVEMITTPLTMDVYMETAHYDGDWIVRIAIYI